MKKFSLVALLLFCAVTSYAQKSYVFRVLQWNIQFGSDVLYRFNLAHQADVIRAADADVVVLSEVEVNCHYTGHVDMAAELGSKVGMFQCFAGAMVVPPKGMRGNAVLSRHDMEYIDSWTIPSTPGVQTRSALLVLIKGGNPFYLVSTHLCHVKGDKGGDAARVAAIKNILEHVKPYAEKYPVVIVGDFNSSPDRPAIKALREAKWEVAQPLKSYPAPDPKVAIDHFAYDPADKRIEIVSRQTIDEPFASDHLPVLTEIRCYGNNSLESYKYYKYVKAAQEKAK